MKKSLLITTLFLITPMAFGYQVQLSGQIYGSGYTTNGGINLSSGSYASQQFTNQRFNYIDLEGNIDKSTVIEIQSSSDSFQTIKERKIFSFDKSVQSFSSEFNELDGKHLRIVMNTGNSSFLKSIDLERKTIFDNPVFWFSGIVIIVGLTLSYIMHKWRTKR